VQQIEAREEATMALAFSPASFVDGETSKEAAAAASREDTGLL